jgi:Bardet-Biedl syndrome 9 protein
MYAAGERNIYCLTETGKLRYMKKLEYDPSCLLPYASRTSLFCIL